MQLARLYASDHDMFAFFIAKDKYLDVSGSELIRGFYIANNEVGTGSLIFCGFICDMVCQNHIIWNVKDSFELKVRHVGNTANHVFSEIVPQALVLTLLDSRASGQEQHIKRAQQHMLGKTKEETVDFLFEKRVSTRKLAERAYAYAEVRHDERGHCDPNSVWGMTCGLTAEARDISFYDQRESIERSATKLMDIVAA